MPHISRETQARIVAQLVNGSGIRATERLTSASCATINTYLLRFGNGCERLHDKLIRDVNTPLIEMDEMWTFVGKKQAKITSSDPQEFGDQYTYVAIDGVNRIVLSYLTGKKNDASTNMFASDLRRRVLGSPQITTDGYEAYIEAVQQAFGTQVKYGQSVKHYTMTQGDITRRYDTGVLGGNRLVPIIGDPDKSKMSTAKVERNNLTMRTWIRRLTRMSSSFSRRAMQLRAAISLHFAYYNFCHVHASLKSTPAMSGRITDHVWTIEELLDAADAALLESGDEFPRNAGSVRRSEARLVRKSENAGAAKAIVIASDTTPPVVEIVRGANDTATLSTLPTIDAKQVDGPSQYRRGDDVATLLQVVSYIGCAADDTSISSDTREALRRAAHCLSLHAMSLAR